MKFQCIVFSIRRFWNWWTAKQACFRLHTKGRQKIPEFWLRKGRKKMPFIVHIKRQKNK